MLSKLTCAAAEIRSAAAYDRNGLTHDLKVLFGTALTDLRPVAGGTLGICFAGKLHGHSRFFKTHAIPSGRETLRREAAFLKATAPDRVEPQLEFIGNGTSGRVWLHTKQIGPCGQLTPAAVRDLIAGYEADLCRCTRLVDQVPPGHNIHLMLSEAESAVAFMDEKKLLSLPVGDAVRSSIERVKLICADRPLRLCHGDLGPNNIMMENDAPVVLDWEDAFWGIAGYDYLYWLTFFGNRRWLSRDSLGHTQLKRADEVAVMIVILLLKSFISVRTDNHHQNTLTVDQRLLEVIRLV